ncbi:MAG TPA: sensor histidine kinase [Puia sp.]|nr:sensor histidine kinase [Puia sp.]
MVSKSSRNLNNDAGPTIKTQQILLHLIGCVVFLSLPLLFSPESLSLHSYLTNPPTQRDIIAYMLVLGVFYSNFYLLIPRLYFRRKYAFYILTNILTFILITEIPDLLIRQPDRPPFPPPGPSFRPNSPNLFRDFAQHLFLFLVVLFLALLLKIRNRLKQAEAEKLHAELAYLKAQVNPHFLFNTLNSIYSLALEKSDRTPDAIVKLSSLMRYVLLETSREKVPLEQEITYLSDYIQLQQTRFEGSSFVDFSISGQPEGKSIAPLLLIPFIENAFKHGVNPEEPSPILIRIDIIEDQLILLVTNKKLASPQPTPIPSGLGIKNTRLRLQLLYPARFILNIDDGTKDFSVSLTLKLT